MQRVRFLILGILLFAVCSSCLFSGIKIYFLGKMNFIRAAGTEADYEVGVNEFPLAAAHSTPGFGAGFYTEYNKNSGNKVFFSLETHFNLGGSVTLTDPSDDDTVRIDTYKYISALFMVGMNLFRTPQFRFFIQAGGGFNITLAAATKIYTSRLGYEVQIDPPDKRTPLTALGGVGFDFNVSDRIGIMLVSRYEYMAFDQPQSNICILAGLIYSF